MSKIYLSLGSNINPRANLKASIEILSSFMNVLRISPVYLSSPWGVKEQDNFLNLVLEGTTDLSAMELLEATQKVESEMGRVRTVKNGPRCLDIDILLFDDLVLDTERLKIPHPGLLDRDFMLQALMDLSPDLKNPCDGSLLFEALEHLKYRQIINCFIENGEEL
jgi:2-amino-4-hydroxy-6-hydroxymethyldihydropteridine diphosphokinase